MKHFKSQTQNSDKAALLELFGPPAILRYLCLVMVATVTLALFLADAHAESSKNQDVEFSDFPVAAPASVGVDAGPLIGLSAWLRKEQYDVRSLLVVKNGKLIFERYTNNLTRDHNYELYSVTKTVVSLLAGILIDKGQISLDDDIASIISSYRPDLAQAVANKKDIELRHVLAMSSGLAYDFDPEDDPIYYGSPDRLKLVADTPIAVPAGTEFEYTDVNPVFATAMLSSAAGMPIQKYAQEKLFEPMGMKNYAWTRADDKGLASGGWGLRLRPVDLAKLGMLILNEGQWQGHQLVPAEWIQKMTTPVAARDFGYYLWLDHIVDIEESFTMMGFKGQFVTMLPRRDTVIVMTSMLPIQGGLRHAKNVRIFRNIVNDYIIPATNDDAEKTPTGNTTQALREELEKSRDTQPEPGVFVDPTDKPQL